MSYIFKSPTPAVPVEKMIDSDDCSRRLGIHKTTLVNKTKAGLIPCYRIPTPGDGEGEYRFLWSEVLAALKVTVSNNVVSSEGSNDSSK